MKTRIIAGIGLLASSIVTAGDVPAQAQSVQTWTISAGLCSDWQGAWAMQHVGPGHWIGTSVIKVVSNRCTRRPIGTQITADVDFQSYASRKWSASTTRTNNASDCQYSGTVNSDNAAAGTYACIGQTGARSNIMITSPTSFYKMGQ